MRREKRNREQEREAARRGPGRLDGAESRPAGGGVRAGEVAQQARRVADTADVTPGRCGLTTDAIRATLRPWRPGNP